MSSHGVSKSTTLRGPKFDDDIDVKRVSTTTQLNAWKIVPSITVKSKNKTEQFSKKCSKGSFTTNVSNRFNGIKDESCDLNLDELNTESMSNSADDIVIPNNTRYRIKTKKTKNTRQKCGLDNLAKPKKFQQNSPCVPKDKRCANCLINHTPFKKFCRWSQEKITEKIKQKNRSEDISNWPQKRPCLNRNIIELLESRINLIEETKSLNSSSTSENNGPQDKLEEGNSEEIARIEAQMDLFNEYFYNEDIEGMVPQFDVDNETFDHEDDNFVPQLDNQNSCTQSPKIPETSTNAKVIKVFLSLSFKLQ